MTDSTPYNMPKEPGRWRAIFLAVLVHALLFGLLWFGIRWQSETPLAVEAEVWSPQVREAAPRPQPQPEPEVKPPPEPEPAPEEPKPVVKETPKPPPVVEDKVDDAAIALEQEKKRLEQQKRLEEEKRKEKERLEKERLEQERQQKLAEEKRLEQERQRKLAEEKRLEKEKQEQLAAAKKKAEAEELKKKLAAQKAAEEKAAAEKLRKERIEAEEKAAEKRHQENLARMAAQAGTPGSGSAPRSQGGRADADYAGRVASKIKSNTIFNIPDTLNGNPAVEYEVELLPDGSLRSMRKIKSSGVPGFDEAVARAIERSAPFPPNRTGTVPNSFNVIHRPKDQ